MTTLAILIIITGICAAIYLIGSDDLPSSGGL